MTVYLVVFSREPVPGATKIRLADGVGDETAARVAEVLLEHTLDVALATGLSVTLALADTPSTEWADRLRVPWEVQGGGGLGDRMRAAFDLRFAADADAVLLIGDAVLLIGSDCPGLAPRHLERAVAALESVPVVLGPAADGGYWCVGQRAPGVDLSAGVAFSSSSTPRRTRERHRALGVDWAEVASLADVDTATDREAALASSRLDRRLAARLDAARDG